MGLKNWVHPETSTDPEERSHPQPQRLGHLFYRRYPRSIRPAVFQSRTPAPQTPNSPLSPPLASILCCSCSYYRYAPAKCKTSICHLSAHSAVKTSFMPFPSQLPPPPLPPPHMTPQLFRASSGLSRGCFTEAFSNFSQINVRLNNTLAQEWVSPVLGSGFKPGLVSHQAETHQGKKTPPGESIVCLEDRKPGLNLSLDDWFFIYCCSTPEL